MKYMNIHIIRTIPLSNLNRDDVGAPKSLMFGGVERSRLSSQSLKRAMRVDFETNTPGERTWRSKFLADTLAKEVEEALRSAGADPETLEGVSAAIGKEARRRVKALTQKQAGGGAGKASKAEGDTADDKKDTLVWLAEADMHVEAARIAKRLLKDGVELSEKAVEAAFADLWEKKTRSLTISAFGRMFAAMPEVQTEAAVQVAHAFTTHGVSNEVDFFTACDDLRDADQGAGHLDVGLFTSGVFYEFFSIDRDQLLDNLHDDAKNDPELRGRLQSLIASMLLALPSGKTAATAPQTLPSLILIEEASQPASYADAFERPVSAAEEGGFTAASEERLLEASERAREMFGGLFAGRYVLRRSRPEGSMSFEGLVGRAVAFIVGDERAE